jgi:hypothetical protein
MLYYKNNTQKKLHVNVQPRNGVVRFFNKIYLAIITISDATPIITETTEKTTLVAVPTPAPLARALLGST